MPYQSNQPNQPNRRKVPPHRPGDPPPSENECAGIDNGPCRSFTPVEWPWEDRCRTCGYPHKWPTESITVLPAPE